MDIDFKQIPFLVSFFNEKSTLSEKSYPKYKNVIT